MAIAHGSKRKIGRPRCAVDPSDVVSRRANGQSSRNLARALGIGAALAMRLFARSASRRGGMASPNSRRAVE